MAFVRLKSIWSYLRIYSLPLLLTAVFLLPGCNRRQHFNLNSSLPPGSVETPDDFSNSLGETSKYKADVAVAWFGLGYELVQAQSYSPPVASRIFGYMGVTLYEAVVTGMPEYRSLAGQLEDLEILPSPGVINYHWPTVANSALAVITKGMFAGGSQATKDKIAELESALGHKFKAEISTGVYFSSDEYGKAIGQAILDWSESDGFAVWHNCAYTPPTGDGMWVPTPPNYAAPLEPCWKKVRTFVLNSSDICDPGPPPCYSEDKNSDFYKEAKEVYNTVKHLTPEQMTIALFWADNPGQSGTPPGHSISILNQVLQNNKMSLTAAAEAYAKLGMAVGDAFISCWDAKYEYNLVRPITYIRAEIKSDWTTPIATPPFPEYTSGHSVQSGAAAQVMTDLFGNMPFVDHTHDSKGFVPRSFNNFFEAADEAAISRLYGGIHFRSAIELGIHQGICIGMKIRELKFHKSGV